MSGNSLEKMLAVMDLFCEEKLEWTPEEMMQILSYSRSTLYRYLRILVKKGFLSAMPNTGYTLGPRIIELDHLLRKSDPLIVLGRPFLLELVNRYPGTAMIVRLFKDKILCVHNEQFSEDMKTSYPRGRLMPITRGATAKAILAFLPQSYLTKLIENNLKDFKEVSCGDNPAAIKQKMKEIRKQGFALAHEEVTPGVYGIAAPIFDAGQTVIASLCITLEDRRVNLDQVYKIAEHIKFSAAVLSTTLSERSRQKKNTSQNPTL